MGINFSGTGWAIVLAVGTLCLIGLLSIYGIELGQSTPARNAIKQSVSLVICLPLAAVLLRIGYVRVTRHAYGIAVLALLTLVPLIVAKATHYDFGGLVPEKRGSCRWIELPGYQFQPSELMKLAYILALAHYLRFRVNYRRFTGLLIPFVLSMIPLFLILLQPDLGTALLIMPVLFTMLFVAGARGRHLLILVLLGMVSLPFLWTKIRPYQRARVMSFLMQSDGLRERIAEQPERFAFTGVDRQEALTWHRSSGLQLVNSKAALGSGGLLGQGLGEGTYVEYNFLPDRHNDFIFASVGHQFGLLGCVVALVCYGIIVIAGMVIASTTDEAEARLLAIGVVALLATQAIINVGMTLGLMPITGMTLPFVSYGGSSLLINILAVTLLISISRHRPFLLAPKPFEFRSE